MVYLDYAATSPYVKFTTSKYCVSLNPNANYAHREKQMLHDCEERIKKAIDAKSGKVLFGGTSSQLVENLFAHIADETNEYLTICSIYEHDAVFRFADQWGNIDSIKHVIETYNGDKQLIVCLMCVNNITGEIFPVEKIGRLCHEHGVFFVCDLTAHIGHTKIPNNIDEWADCAFWSGHKIGTECGIGCMWLSNRFNNWLNDMIIHGTPNLAGALAICDATEYAVDNLRAKEGQAFDLYIYLKDKLTENQIEFNDVCGEFTIGKYTPFINAIQLVGINADALQQYAASKNVYIGIGASACQNVGDYRILTDGYELTKQEASEVVRISFGENTTCEDIDKLVSIICEFKRLFT